MKLFYAYEMVEQPSSAMLHGYFRPRHRIGFSEHPNFGDVPVLQDRRCWD